MTKCDWCKSAEHIELLEKLCDHDLDTQQRNLKIGKFFGVYPQICGLSYDAADILRKEKNLKIREPAIATVAAEIKRRANVDSPNYSISRRRVTADKVREILNEARTTIEGTHLQREKLFEKQAKKEMEDKDVQYTCPLCHGLITIQLSKRDKIVSLRVTEDADDAYAYLAKEFNVPRSKILSVLLGMRPKFPNMFKE